LSNRPRPQALFNETATKQEGLQVRQERSRPLMIELEAWLREHSAKLSKNSGTTKAINYCLNRWDALIRFLDDGRLCISNDGRVRWLEGCDEPQLCLRMARRRPCATSARMSAAGLVMPRAIPGVTPSGVRWLSTGLCGQGTPPSNCAVNPGAVAVRVVAATRYSASKNSGLQAFLRSKTVISRVQQALRGQS
jgi:hypothetical protein